MAPSIVRLCQVNTGGLIRAVDGRSRVRPAVGPRRPGRRHPIHRGQPSVSSGSRMKRCAPERRKSPGRGGWCGDWNGSACSSDWSPRVTRKCHECHTCHVDVSLLSRYNNVTVHVNRPSVLVRLASGGQGLRYQPIRAGGGTPSGVENAAAGCAAGGGARRSVWVSSGCDWERRREGAGQRLAEAIRIERSLWIAWPAGCESMLPACPRAIHTFFPRDFVSRRLAWQANF